MEGPWVSVNPEPQATWPLSVLPALRNTPPLDGQSSGPASQPSDGDISDMSMGACRNFSQGCLGATQYHEKNPGLERWFERPRLCPS